jgi:adenylate kinase family enzyme
MLEALKQRTVIIGNSGSGKSVLAARLASLFHLSAIDLDHLHWEGDGFGRKREEEAAKRLVGDAAAASSWIIEGVFGWLAEIAMLRATALIWLDLPWRACREGLLARGLQRGGTQGDLAALLSWARDYWDRQTSSSFKGHSCIFESFLGAKVRLRNREEVSEFYKALVDSESALN